MSEKIIQLPLWPDAWWNDIDRWRLRIYKTSVSRPVEDEAFDNMFWQAMALRNGGFRCSLNAFERHVFDLDMRARRTKPHYFTEHDRATWVAEQLRGKVSGAWHVKDILRDIDFIVRSYGHNLAAMVSKAKHEVMLEAIRDNMSPVTSLKIAS